MKYKFVCLNCKKSIKPNPNISTCQQPRCEGAFDIVYTNRNMWIRVNGFFAI